MLDQHESKKKTSLQQIITLDKINKIDIPDLFIVGK